MHSHGPMELPFIFQINILFTAELLWIKSADREWEIRNYIIFMG